MNVTTMWVSPWISVWTRAVIVPASRRAAAAWMGCTIVGAVVFGPTAMHASDLTGLALHVPGVGLVLTAIWLLLFAPTARIIVRAQPAAFLASLPGDPRTARLVAAASLVWLQLPWIVLWIVGEGWLGVAVVAVTTALVVGLASWRPPPARTRIPAWRRAGQALRGVHLRALRRRAGDALVRGAGLSVLAGMAAGLLIRNNHLLGESAGVLGASIIAVALIPAQVGPALVTLGAYRETAWIVQAFGIAPAVRIGALIATVATVHLGAAAIAIAAAMVVAGVHPWLPLIAFGTALGTALGEARTILTHEASPTIATRVVVSAIVAAAIAVVCLSVLDATGVLAILAIGSFAILVAAS
jgi:hypothetical protein